MLPALTQAIQYARHDRLRSWHGRHAPKEWLDTENTIDLIENPRQWPDLLERQTALRRKLVASNGKVYPITFLPPASYALRYWAVMQLAEHVNGLWTARIGAEHLSSQGRHSLFLGRTNKNAQVYQAWMNAQNKRYVLKLDIASFFDSVPHAKLCQSIRTSLGETLSPETSLALETLPLLLSYRYREEEGKAVHVCERGLPIGNTTERFFSNVYLREIDQYLLSYPRITCCRKLDDIRVYGDDIQILENIRNSLVEKMLFLGLEINSYKTKIARKI